MDSFKQALNVMKTSWQNSIILGMTATAFVFLAWASPYLSAYIISLGILIFQEVGQRLAVDNTWPRHLYFRGKGILAFVLTALVLLPTSVLLGSSIGFLESPQGLVVTIPLSLGLMILALYFYFVLSQALRLHFEKNISIAQSIDIVGLASFRNFKFYLALSFYSGIMILAAGMTKGVGLVGALPLLFFVNHFAYLEISRRGFNLSVPQ